MPHTTVGLNLLISGKPDSERDALADAFAHRGGEVHRLSRFWEPPVLDPATVRVYGADSFCLVLQQKLGFALCSPADDLLLKVPPRFLQRQLATRTLSEVRSLAFPGFIKPVTPKQFRGAVYKSASELTQECHGLSPDTAVFVAEAVTLTAEVRSFVLDDGLAPPPSSWTHVLGSRPDSTHATRASRPQKALRKIQSPECSSQNVVHKIQIRIPNGRSKMGSKFSPDAGSAGGAFTLRPGGCGNYFGSA